MTEAVQILCWSNCKDRDDSHFSTYPWFFLEVTIIQEVGQGKGYSSWGSELYTTQYQEAFLKYVENEYSAKHQQISAIIPETLPGLKIFPSAKAGGFGQSSLGTYDLCCDEENYVTPKSLGETTPRWSDYTALLLTAARLDLNSPPEARKNWGQVNLNLHDYHFDHMEICSTHRLPDITDWWRQQVKTH